MPTYIESSNCKGLRPTGIIGARHNMRPEIVGRLIKDRHVARYIIAPKGYGRSSIAFEYAQLVFAFKNVFWLRCSSPCFIRDLDGRKIKDEIQNCDPSFKLVVFDDVPVMDQERSRSFNELVDELLAAECEVIAISTPAADSFSSLQLDKILLKGSDLLLSTEEIDLECLRGNLPNSANERYPASLSAPSQIWGKKESFNIVSGMAAEDLPLEIKQAMFSILVLGKGKIEDLSPIFFDHQAEEVLEYLSLRYPILGIDLADSEFDAADIPIDTLKRSFHQMMDITAQDRSNPMVTLIGYLARTLVESESCVRAIELVTSLLNVDEASVWLTEYGFLLLAKGYVFNVWKSSEAYSRALSDAPGELLFLRAFGRWLFGEGSAALRICRALMDKGNTLSGSNLHVSLSMLLMEAELSEQINDATVKTLKAELKKAEELHLSGSQLQNGVDQGVWPNWKTIGKIALRTLSNETGFSECDQRIQAIMDKNIKDQDVADIEGADVDRDRSEEGSRIATVLFTIMLMSTLFKCKNDLTYEERDSYLQSMCALHSAIPKTETHDMGFLRGAAASSLLDAVMSMGAEYTVGDRRSLIEDARYYQKTLNSEKSKYFVFLEKNQQERDRFSLTNTDSEISLTLKRSSQERIRATIPTLFITLFGGFSAKSKDEGYQLRRITRAKSKKALALLAISKGNEVNKEQIGKLLWPESDRIVANRNFYVVWADLKKNLSVNGSCPYLIKSHVGYKLDMRHVSIDLDDFDDLCRRLLFGKDDMSEWEVLYEKATGNFSGEILPEFVADRDFKDIRDRCSMQLVDGLVAASMRMLNAGENRGAVWFAREALRHDDLREDVYKTLIRSYIATEQRAAALDAYFQCRNRLRDELGIDPSPSIVELYRSIIEAEEKM